MEPLKEMFNKKFFVDLSNEFQAIDKNFSCSLFLKDITKNLEELELNQRLRHATTVLNKYLPSDFKKAIPVLKKVIPAIKAGYTTLIFPDYVGQFGKNHVQESLDALKYFTRFGSSEFAIREFLRIDFEHTISVMQQWATDDCYHVRRLASEGSRPRLPWSFKLDQVIKNPIVTYPILETLKDDPELYVRKSVANHLNDISKDNPKFFIDILKNWKGGSNTTEWILKHGSRTLLKKGDVIVLKQFGIKHHDELRIVDFKIVNPKIKIGELLSFHCTVINNSLKKTKIRIEYAVYFKLKNGMYSKKVYKIKETELSSKESLLVSKKHNFKVISTRRFVVGEQGLSVIVNGKEHKKLEFKLTAKS